MGEGLSSVIGFGRSESCEWGCQSAVVLNESTIEVGKTKESLMLLERTWNWPLYHHLDLFRVCSHLPTANDETQKHN